jgi:lysyl-tRNA synthetase class I
MNMQEFKFNNSYEEFKIGGKTYKVDFSDEKIKEYIKSIKEYESRAKELEERSKGDLSEEQQLQLIDDSLKELESFIDLVLGKGNFTEIYEASGKSMYNMQLFSEWLAVFLGENVQKKKGDAIKRYKK